MVCAPLKWETPRFGNTPVYLLANIGKPLHTGAADSQRDVHEATAIGFLACMYSMSRVRKRGLLQKGSFQGGPGSVRFGYGSGVERFERFRFSVPAVPSAKKVFLCFSTV